MADTGSPEVPVPFARLAGDEEDPVLPPQWPRFKYVAILATVLGVAGVAAVVFFHGGAGSEVSEDIFKPLPKAPLEAFAVDSQDVRPRPHSFPTEIEAANHLMMNDPERAKELWKTTSYEEKKALTQSYLATVGTSRMPKSERRNTYDTLVEFKHRLQVLSKSIEDIIALNIQSHKGDLSPHRARYAIGMFGDWTEDEFRGLNTENATGTEGPAPADLAAQPHCSGVYKQLGPAHQQGPCGSCWTHSTVGTLRTGLAVKYGDPGDLSAQFLIDCDASHQNTKCAIGVKGCCGGNRLAAWNSVRSLGGVPTKASYPDTSDRQPKRAFPCKRNVRKVGTVDGYILPNGPYDMSVKLCTMGSLSVGVWAEGAIQHYNSGVIPARACSPPGRGRTNHAVELVGIDAQHPGGPAWIIRNSWGPMYGVTETRPYKSNRASGGYFLLSYGEDTCSVETGHPSIGKNYHRP